MGLSDEGLLAGVAAGDTDAMAAFVRRYQARVYGLALTMVGTSALAEEVAQEAFVRVWRHAETYDPRRGRASVWVLTIVRNLAIDVLRMRREYAVEPAAIERVLTPPADTEPIGVGERVAESDRITSALRGLPREQAVAVVLSVHFGLTAAEIGAREHIPLGTAKSRIRTGLSRLRQTLEVSHDDSV